MLLFSLYNYRTIYLVIVLAILLMIFMVLGIWIRSFFERKAEVREGIDLGIVEGSLLGMFAFFLAFTFSMSGARYDARRQAIIDEANAMGTAIIRADLFPDSIRNDMRSYFEKYLDARISYAYAGIDDQKIDQSLIEATGYSDKLWSMVAEQVRENRNSEATRQMIPALNSMMDMAIVRDAARTATVPSSIIYVLILLSFCAAFLVGYGYKGRAKNYLPGGVLIIMISIAIFLIIDLDKPRRGVITLEKTHQKIMDLKALFR